MSEIAYAVAYARVNTRPGRMVDGPTVGFLLAKLDRLEAHRAAALAIHVRTDYGCDGWCCRYCVDGHENPIPWPCPTAEALGVDA